MNHSTNLDERNPVRFVRIFEDNVGGVVRFREFVPLTRRKPETTKKLNFLLYVQTTELRLTFQACKIKGSNNKVDILGFDTLVKP
jgi:hypothetical protein